MSKKIHEMMKEINGLNKEMANIWEEIGNGKKKNADTNEWENDEKQKILRKNIEDWQQRNSHYLYLNLLWIK